MELYHEVLSLKPGSEELLKLRDSVVRGDLKAAKVYVYFCALQSIRADNTIPKEEELPLFRQLVEADLISVDLEQTTPKDPPDKSAFQQLDEELTEAVSG